MGRGGGGASDTPSYLKKTTIFSDKKQMALDRPRRDLKLLDRPFSGQINIEVTRGNQRPNFEKIAIVRKQWLSTTIV